MAKFSALAAEWWDPTGKFAPLHKFNPVRLAFIRREAAARFGRDGKSLRPFEGLSLLDIGCGGGLLSEPMARLGFAVTGADASEHNIGTARAHAAESGVPVGYRTASAEMLAAEGLSFDVVLNMEVVEHVADVRAYLAACAGLVKPGGITIVATLNKTLVLALYAKISAEYVLELAAARARMTGTDLLPPDAHFAPNLKGVWPNHPENTGRFFRSTGLGLEIVARCGRQLHGGWLPSRRAEFSAWPLAGSRLSAHESPPAAPKC